VSDRDGPSGAQNIYVSSSATRRKHRRRLWAWFGGVATAVAVTLVSGIVLAIVAPGGALPRSTSDHTAGVTAPAATASPTPDPLPFTVRVSPVAGHCSPLILDRPPADVPVPSADRDTADGGFQWAREVGAVVGDTELTVTLQGTSANAVVLEGLDVLVVARRPAITTQSLYYLSRGCGGVTPPRSFVVDLDKSIPKVTPVAGRDDADNVIPPVSFPLKVANNDPEILSLGASPKQCDCTWYLKIRWISEGKPGTTAIDDGGQPFHTAGFAGQPTAYLRSADGWQKS
jgi:hypothetical protein